MQPDDNDIVVTPGSLLTHAGHVEAIVDEVDVAKAAAAHVRLDSRAYGLICAFVPTYLNGLSDGLMSGLDATVTSLRDTATRLRAAAAGFEDAEHAAYPVDAARDFGPLDRTDP
jgi:Excreted virulence factor EspC, type VII ESX diderm